MTDRSGSCDLPIDLLVSVETLPRRYRQPFLALFDVLRPVGPFSAYEIGTMLVEDVYDPARRQLAPEHVASVARAFEDANDTVLADFFLSPVRDLDAIGKLEQACWDG